MKLFEDSALIGIFSYHGWRHRIPLGKGLHTPGYNTLPTEWDENHLPNNLNGKTFLDIGANDGFFSFEAEKRGAKHVWACDIYHGDSSFMTLGWNERGIQSVKEYLQSKVEIGNVSVFDLQEHRLHADLVWCSDVLSWLSDAERAIKIICESAGEKIFIKDSFLKSKDSVRRTIGNGLQTVYRMSPAYLESEILKNGFRISWMKNIVATKLYEYQAEHFPAVYSNAEVPIFLLPNDKSEVIKTVQFSGNWLLYTFDNFGYVRDTGWVRISDVDIRQRITKNGIKGKIKKFLPTFMKERLQSKSAEEFIEMVICAEKIR